MNNATVTESVETTVTFEILPLVKGKRVEWSRTNNGELKHRRWNSGAGETRYLRVPTEAGIIEAVQVLVSDEDAEDAEAVNDMIIAHVQAHKGFYVKRENGFTTLVDSVAEDVDEGAELAAL